MGWGSWTSEDWKKYSSAKKVYSSKRVEDIYAATCLDERFNPKGIKYRESCDSVDNPNSTAIIVGLDVTGSMSGVLDTVVKKLNILVEEIYRRKPVPDPHLMFMGIGDTAYDDAPLQVTQFEADIRIAEELTSIWFEKGGGGNLVESYTLPWYFAANHTKIDCFEKRGKKGFLFTIGDELPPDVITSKEIKKVIGDRIKYNKITSNELLNQVSRMYEVFHLIIKEGYNCSSIGIETTRDKWSKLLGQRAIVISDCDKIPEIIVSTLQIFSGQSTHDVLNSWDSETSSIVKNALINLENLNSSNGLIRF